MAVFVILRAAFGYLFLVLMVRVVGRRPGKQLTPFEFVLVFYLGGLTLTGMVGTEASLTNAVTQILTVAVCHYVLASLRYRFDAFAQSSMAHHSFSWKGMSGVQKRCPGCVSKMTTSWTWRAPKSAVPGQDRHCHS